MSREEQLEMVVEALIAEMGEGCVECGENVVTVHLSDPDGNPVLYCGHHFWASESPIWIRKPPFPDSPEGPE